MRIPSGVTDQYIYFVAVDATDFSTREKGLSSFTVYRSRNGAAAAAMTTPTINETDTTNMPGVYELLLDEDMTIGSGNDSEEMCFHITHAGMAPVTRTIELYRPKITAGNTLGVASDGDVSGNVDGSVASVTGAVGSVTGAVGSVTATVSADIVSVSGDSVAADNLEADYDGTGYNKSNSTIGTCTTNTDMLTNAGIADAVWDEALSGHQTAGTAGRNLTLGGTILSETTLTGTPSTTVVRLTAGSTTADFYNDMELYFITGNAAGLSRIITDYDGTNRDCTFDEALPVTPNSGDAVVVKTIHKHSRSQIASSVTTDMDANSTKLSSIETDTQDIQSRLPAALTAGGNIKADVLAISGDTTAADNCEAFFDDTGFNASNSTIGTCTTNTDMRGTDGAYTGTPPTAATIADAVWDEASASHVAAGSTGKVISDILTDTGTTIPNQISGLNDLSAAAVNAEVVDALNVDTYAEPGQGAPGATVSLAAKINYLYKAWRNKSTQTATQYSLYDDAGSTIDQKATVSDDGTTATVEEISTGP